jgi:type IV secretory pathway VirB10-like protein
VKAREPRDSGPKLQPALPPLTPEQAAALKPLDAIYVNRFHREGQVVRVNPARHLAIVSVGMLEMEVPFSGLALAPRSDRPRPPRAPAPRPTAVQAASADQPQEGPPVVAELPPVPPSETPRIAPEVFSAPPDAPFAS